MQNLRFNSNLTFHQNFLLSLWITYAYFSFNSPVKFLHSKDSHVLLIVFVCFKLRGRQRDRDILGWGWSRVKTMSQELKSDLPWGWQKSNYLNLSWSKLTGHQHQKLELGTEPRHSNVRRGHLKCQAKCLLHIFISCL